MSLTKVLCQQPRFKERVFLKFKDTSVEIRYRDRGFSITLPPEDLPQTEKLLRLLQVGGRSAEQLAQACPGIGELVPELLAEFNQRGLLANPQEEVTSRWVTGRQFYRELYQFLQRLKKRFPPSPFLLQMLEGSISRNQLIGYVLESYHVTHLCPRLVAPSLANYELPSTQQTLQEFFVSELHHDRLIENSLKSVGIKEEQMKQMQPLPMTFAVCSTLGILATQHPLSFKSALMLFEEDDKAFHELFKQRCQAEDLPSEFYQPILLHARINDEGAHEEITEILLADVPCISPEETVLVKKNIGLLMESMVLRTHEILKYYGNSNNIIPRCFTAPRDRSLAMEVR